MGNTKKNKQIKSEGAPGVQSPHAIFAKESLAITHGLYRTFSTVDWRTKEGRAIKAMTAALLERFHSPAPATAQVIAQRCAVKLIRAASYESFVLKGGKAAPNADRDYLAMTGSIRADIQALWVMSRESGTPDPVPDLQTYLASLEKVSPKGGE